MIFKKREETKFLYVVKEDLKGAKKDTLFRNARKSGEFDTGYHFILSKTGILETDRDKECVAGWELQDNLVSVYVLADSTGKLTDAQHAVIKELLDRFGKLKLIEV